MARPCTGKKKRRKGQPSSPPAPSTSVDLFTDATCGHVVPDATPNALAWRPPATLRVGASAVPITWNPPTVASIQVHTPPMVGHPVIAAAELAHMDGGSCHWQWERLAQSQNKAAPVDRVGTGRTYTPGHEDLGLVLRVTATPTTPAGVIGEPASVTTGAQAATTAALSRPPAR